MVLTLRFGLEKNCRAESLAVLPGQNGRRIKHVGRESPTPANVAGVGDTCPTIEENETERKPRLRS